MTTDTEADWRPIDNNKNDKNNWNDYYKSVLAVSFLFSVVSAGFLLKQDQFLSALDIPEGLPMNINRPLSNCFAPWTTQTINCYFLTKEESFLTVFSGFCLILKPFACVCQQFHQPERQ